MQTMPRVIHGGRLPVVPVDAFDRAIAALVGRLTPAERAYVEQASDHNHTLRVIVDALRERRGVPPVAPDFDWRSLLDPVLR